MNDHLRRLEEKVHRKGSPTTKRPYYLVAIALVGLVVAFSLASVFRDQISADVIDTAPPVPPAPSTNLSPVKPPNPTDNTNPDNLSFVSGWSMIAGSTIAGYDFAPFKDAGLYLYSYNDPTYPVSEWATYPTGQITPQAPLGYYVFNPTSETKKVTLKDKNTPASDTVYGRGWHLIYWPGVAVSYSELAGSVKLTYSDGTGMTLAEAVSSENHRASVKIYVAINENSLESSAVKELTTEDSTTTISKIPQKSYFWVYLRRSKNRVTRIEVAQ